jgi:hypothetical protein
LEPGANSTAFEFTPTTPAFLRVEDNILVFNTHLTTRSIINFYSAGVLTHDRSIGSPVNVLENRPKSCQVVICPCSGIEYSLKSFLVHKNASYLCKKSLDKLDLKILKKYKLTL